MGRLRGSELVLGFLLATALWSILIAVFQQYNADDRLATYTSWLVAVFTAVLAISTIGLWSATSRNAQAAEKAANAADLSAQAAIGLQLPRLTVGSTELFNPGPPYGVVAFSSRIEGGTPPEWSQIAIQFNNIGKTSAFVTEQCIEDFVGPRLPAMPKYTIIIPLPAGAEIEAEGLWQFQVMNRFIHLTAERRKAMETMKLNHSLWVYGFLRFTDFMGHWHEFRFCKRWCRVSILGSPTGFVSESRTPPEYTRSY